jgi:hypothetical protein
MYLPLGILQLMTENYLNIPLGLEEEGAPAHHSGHMVLHPVAENRDRPALVEEEPDTDWAGHRGPSMPDYNLLPAEVMVPPEALLIVEVWRVDPLNLLWMPPALLSGAQNIL